MKRTSRGFAIYSEIKDFYGNDVRLQESPSGARHCCSIFCRQNGLEGCKYRGSWRSYSPHLTKAQARRVAAALLKFANGK